MEIYNQQRTNFAIGILPHSLTCTQFHYNCHREFACRRLRSSR